MAEISQILDIEQQNTDCIHLFRVGLFYRAYQRSAYLFQTRVRNFKAVKKYMKATGCDVAMLGFPSQALNGMFPAESIRALEEGHVAISVPEPLDTRMYQEWFSVVPYAEVKKKAAADPAPSRMGGQRDSESLFPPVAVIPDGERPAAAPRPAPAGAGERVLRQLEAFALESATPLDCMMFLSRLKSELKGGADGRI